MSEVLPCCVDVDYTAKEDSGGLLLDMTWRKLFGLLGAMCKSRHTIVSFLFAVRLSIAALLGLAIVGVFERPSGELLAVWLSK